VRQPDPWFGLKYSFNLYRGCQHQCIYCDSRSECYQIEDFNIDEVVKAAVKWMTVQNDQSSDPKSHVAKTYDELLG
jgi:DNA repair photolyase